MKSLVKIRLFLTILCMLAASLCCCFAFVASPTLSVIRYARFHTAVQSSFYDDFESFDEDDEDDDDEEDDDDDDYDDVDDAAVASFRSKIGGLFGEEEETSSVDELISFATSKAMEEVSTDWAKPVDKIETGCVLVANPASFCAGFGGKKKSPSSSLLNKFGLTLPPPADLGPDRRADLLPVLIILERHALKGSQQA